MAQALAQAGVAVKQIAMFEPFSQLGGPK